MKTLGIVIVIVVLLGLGWYFYLPSETSVKEGSSTPGNAPVAAPSASKEILVEITASGFSPSSLTLKVGDMVRFVNKDTKNHWPASAVHPTHQCYPGFDALQAVRPGASYVFTFNVAKTCAFHDHLNPGSRGSITVQ